MTSADALRCREIDINIVLILVGGCSDLDHFRPKIENARNLAASGAFRMIFSSMDQCIVSFCLSMRRRVTPLPRSSRSARVASLGCPVPAPFLLSRRPNPQVALWFRAFGRAGDGRSSCPERRMPLALPVSASFRVTPENLAFSYPACDEGLGSPLVLHLRLYRRWTIESPRCSHHSAVPTYQSPGFPKSQPFGIADDSLSESPRTLNPPAPIDGYPSYLGSRTIRFALVRSPSCPGHLPSATAIDQFPGCPKSWVSHRSPIPRASSCPESWFLG